MEELQNCQCPLFLIGKWDGKTEQKLFLLNCSQTVLAAVRAQLSLKPLGNSPELTRVSEKMDLLTLSFPPVGFRSRFAVKADVDTD